MNFPSALAVGIAGLDEVVELELTEACEHERLAAQIAPHCPNGLEIRAVEGVDDEARASQVACLSYELHVPLERRAAAADRIAALLAREQWLVERDEGRAAADLRPLVASISLDGGQLRMELRATRQTNVRPRQVLAALGLDDLEEQGVFLTRTRVELES
jgi:radical SAM-linked protein